MADPMQRELLALARCLAPKDITLVVGGGYGLYLREEHLRRTGAQTRFPTIPVSRSTSDIDIVLTADIIVDGTKMAHVREALDTIGYVPLVNFFQFIRREDHDRGIRTGMKFDLLAQVPEDLSKVQLKPPRIRPHDTHGLHGYATPEALTIKEHLLTVELEDDDAAVSVSIPHPYSQLLLKLFALRDRLEDSEKQFGRHHAYDVYRCLAMMTSDEWDQATEIRTKYSSDPTLGKAGQIVSELFGSESAPGMLRLREHAQQIQEPISARLLAGITTDLKELFDFDR